MTEKEIEFLKDIKREAERQSLRDKLFTLRLLNDLIPFCEKPINAGVAQVIREQPLELPGDEKYDKNKK